MKALPILTMLLAACGGSEMLAEEADGSVVLREGTVVDPDELVPGTVVISSEGVGSVRRVVGPNQTEPASLFDAFAAATYRHAIAIDREKIPVAIEADGVTVDATIAIDPEIDLAFTIDDAGLARFDAIASGSFDVQITSSARMSGGGWDGVKTVASRPFRILTTVDGVPVVLGARVITDLAVYAGGRAELGAELATKIAFNTGVHFTRATGWTASDASTPSVGGHELVALGDGHTNAVATVRLELALYGEVVPYIQLRTVQNVEAGSCAKGSYEALEAGVGAGVGISPSTLLPGAELRYTAAFDTLVPIVSATCP